MNRKKELLEAFFLIILFLFIIAQLVLPETGIGGVLTRREQEIPHFYKWGMNCDKHGVFLTFMFHSIII